MLPGTSERVPANTDSAVNDRIQQAAEARIAYYAVHRGQIDQRLKELEREWDIERTLEINGSVLAMAGLFLGTVRGRKWFALPIAVVSFCLQHALQGWCPPLAVFRRLGIRTQREIDEERTSLRALRGDFDRLSPRHPRNGKQKSRHATRTSTTRHRVRIKT